MNNLNKILIVICLFIGAQAAKGQNKFIEYTLQPSSEGSTTRATAVTNGWMVPFNIIDCQHEGIAYINKYTGAIKYLPTPDGNADEIDDIIQTGPNEFICVGYYGIGFDVIGKTNALMFKMDSSGNIIWKTFFGNTDLYMDGHLVKVVLGSDSSIYGLATGSQGFIAKADPSGKNLWSKPLPNINDILWTAKGLIATVGNNIWLLDTSGAIVKKYNFAGKSLQKLQNVSATNIFATGYGSAWLIDSSFKVTDSLHFAFDFPNNLSSNLAIGSDSAYYFYNIDSIASLNLKGKVNWRASVPEGNLISGLAYNGDQIAVAGNGEAPFIKTFDKKGNTAPINRDIGITDITTKSVLIQSQFQQPDTFPIKNVTADLNVVVKNFGTETIDSLYLESVGGYIGDYYDCVENSIASFHNLNLTTGNSVTLPLTITRIMISPVNSGYPLNFLVNSVSPNGKLDMNASNDSFRFSHIVTGIKQDQMAYENINIYPNPVTNILNIDNSMLAMHTNASIQSITGQVLLSFKDLPKHFEINFEALPSGIYFVKLQNENGIVVRKVIKE